VRPVIHGVQTAVVVGPPGEEIHTDGYGRVKVQFHWDRLGTFDDGSSAWIRVMSGWAGANFGQVSLPRVGMEVAVQFLDGDVDRPLVVGCLYNASHMPPWELPANQTQSGILSRSSADGRAAHANALRFEDLKGEEELWLHAEKDQRIEVEHDESHWVGNDRSKAVARDETVHIGRDRRETVGRDEHIDIGGNRSEGVGGNERIHIGGNKTERVGLDSSETVMLAKALAVGGGYQESAGAAMHTSVALSQSGRVTLDKTTTVGESYEIAAGELFSIDVGQASLRMDKDGAIVFKGTGIHIVASETVTINGRTVEIDHGAATLAGLKLDFPEMDKLLNEDCWVEFRLTDGTGPLPGQRYRLTDPEGNTHTGILDKDAYTRVAPVKLGLCKVEFPDIAYSMEVRA
jgi:type VI secretion system secreted protein VgrG